MRDDNFSTLGERLLRAGIAPRHVRRLLDELAAHHALLIEEETGRGQPPDTARSLARERLGTDDEIVARARAQVALRSWGARWPLACAIAPFLGMVGSAVLLMASLVLLCSLAAAGGDAGTWLRRGTQFTGWIMMYGLPLVWVYVLARYSVSRRLRWGWPLAGLILTAAAGAGTTFEVVWPHPGVRGQLSGGIGLCLDGALIFVTRALATLIAGVALYALIRARSEPRTTA